jgi:hypothetical protein
MVDTLLEQLDHPRRAETVVESFLVGPSCCGVAADADPGARRRA